MVMTKRCLRSPDSIRSLVSSLALFRNQLQMITTWKTDKSWLHAIERPTSKDDCHAGSGLEEGNSLFLDAVVFHANRLTLFRVRYKPYWVMSDAAALSAQAYAWAFSKRFPDVSGLGLGLAILVALLIYKIVLETKAALGKEAARSFLQDCLLVIIPCFLVVSLLFKQPPSLALAFLGTLLPLYGCLARVGCFLGGCCYGKPSTNGVLYPRTIFESTGHRCRRYSASADPGTRVFPIQLVEAAAQAMLFGIFAIMVWQYPSTAGSIFWLYLSMYSVVRFVLDFYRTTSARPRYWHLSEAQLICIAVQAVSLAVLVRV
jgi:phosphatidylglycerol---prolipoprotein diacylglyceryl transferase